MVPSEQRQEVTDKIEKSQRTCLNCYAQLENHFRCSACHSGIYCSKQCQTSHNFYHKEICTAIQEVENYSNTMFVNNIRTSFQSHLSPKEESKIVKPIGSKCLVNCSINDISTEAFLDSDAQESSISESWFKSNFDIPIRPISDIVGSEVIDLKAANGSEIPCLGFVELDLKLTSADISNSTETLRWYRSRKFCNNWFQCVRGNYY